MAWVTGDGDTTLKSSIRKRRKKYYLSMMSLILPGFPKQL
jgi:hypothetical protein